MKHWTVGPSYDTAEVNGWVLPNTQRGLPSVPYGRFNGQIHVCGSGPSLRELYPKDGGPVAALNGSWRVLLEKGIRPEFIIAFDPAPETARFFDDAPDDAAYLLASCMHPSVLEKLRGKNVFQWHAYSEHEKQLGIGPLIGGGFSVGCVALNLLNQLGFTHFDCWGYDSCYIDGRHHATDQDWNITPPQPFQVGERMFIAEPWMSAQVQEFLLQIEANRWNYTIDVKGDGYLAAALEWNTLNVIYDLDVAPGSFDFMCSMLNVENFRREHGYSRVKVHFKAGSDKGFRPNDVIDIGHEQKNRMLNHVVRPLLQMFGFEETGDDPGEAGFVFQYSPKESLKLFEKNGILPQFKANRDATEWAQRNYSDNPYVITLRETYYWPQRNSNVAEWIRFAETLDRRVIFVRDTWKHDKPLAGFETCPQASLDLHKRLALYRQAKMNFFVPNGPGGLAWYTKDIPHLTFYPKVEGYKCQDPEFLEDHVGLKPHGQYPWAGPHQRLVYANDTFENITAAFNAMEQS